MFVRAYTSIYWRVLFTSWVFSKKRNSGTKWNGQGHLQNTDTYLVPARLSHPLLHALLENNNTHIWPLSCPYYSAITGFSALYTLSEIQSLTATYDNNYDSRSRNWAWKLILPQLNQPVENLTNVIYDLNFRVLQCYWFIWEKYRYPLFSSNVVAQFESLPVQRFNCNVACSAGVFRVFTNYSGINSLSGWSAAMLLFF